MCLHLSVETPGQCPDCGELVVFTEVIPPDLGDIIGIIRLIDITAESYAQLVAANTDPSDSSLPKLRLIGGHMLRIPHRAIFKELLGPSFNEAKQLGYRGDFARWSQIIQEASFPR